MTGKRMLTPESVAALERWAALDCPERTRAVHLVICGAESGPNRRPFDVRWAADLYRQCQDAGVAYFGKQDSALKPGAPLLIDGEVRQGWPAARG